GHFNPYNKLHGGQNFTIDHRHVGDLGNVWVDGSGTATINIIDYIIQLYNQTQSIANRTLVVHQMTDDNGLGNSTDSNTTGHAVHAYAGLTPRYVNLIERYLIDNSNNIVRAYFQKNTIN
ncbi:unnamed protein product, partial [Didymodactylos carnosus]